MPPEVHVTTPTGNVEVIITDPDGGVEVGIYQPPLLQVEIFPAVQILEIEVVPFVTEVVREFYGLMEWARVDW